MTFKMGRRSETIVLILSLILTGGLIGIPQWLLKNDVISQEKINSQGEGLLDLTTNSGTMSVDSLLSKGKKFLISGSNATKQTATSAYAIGQYHRASTLLKTALKTQPNDPEALIYLNNSQIVDRDKYTIAVSVPISQNVFVAKEILKGVAQAQQEINQNGGIKGKPLEVIVANDRNEVLIAKQLAKNFGKDKNIIGVIGHFSSDLTQETAKIYRDNNLVLISPHSTSLEFSKLDNPYLFRTLFGDRTTGNILAKYMLEDLKIKKAAVFYDSTSPESTSLKNVFSHEVFKNGGRVLGKYDLNQGNFNPNELLNIAKEEGVEAIVLFPNSNSTQSMNNSIEIIKNNDRQLPLLSDNSLHSQKTWELTGELSSGMVSAVYWSDIVHKSNFDRKASKLWKSEVSWYSSMSYDATKSLEKAIEINPTRQGIQEVLNSPDFKFSGASGKVSFNNGDRKETVTLVKINSDKSNDGNFNFVIE